jgi:hypothetical protein
LKHTPWILVCLAGLALAALPCAAAGQSVAVTIHRPTAGQLSGSSLAVAASVNSTHEIQSVTATVGTSQAALSFSLAAYCDPTCHPGWSGTVSLTGLPRGPQTLVVTAVDVLANSGQAQLGFVYDELPAINVISPIEGSVARPWIRMAATCTDDDPAGCSSVEVGLIAIGVPTVYGPVFASGTSSFDSQVLLAAYDFSSRVLRFTATDSAGQTVFVYRNVFIESSPSLYEVASLGGPILDVQPDRILFRQGAGWTQTPQGVFYDYGSLFVRNRASGVDTQIPAAAGSQPEYGHLTPIGAIFVVGKPVFPYTELLEWRGGATSQVLGFANASDSLRVSGDYAIWSEGSNLYRYVVSSQQKTLVTASPVVNTNNDVAANGDVVYATQTDLQIFRYRGGVNTPLTNDAPLKNSYPRTDGINVVYRKATTTLTDWEIAFHDGSVETILDSFQPVEVQPDSAYQVEGGWTAYTRRAMDGTRQVWVRSPLGVFTQLSSLAGSSHVESLSPGGRVAFVFNNRRYLAAQGEMPVEVSSGLPTSLWENEIPFVALGRSLFRIGAPVTPLRFFTLDPCRVLDTRSASGPLGGPKLAGGAPRTFPVAGVCGIPASAKSIAVNLAVNAPESAGFVRLFAGNGAPPDVSAINFDTGQTRAGNAVVLLATDGSGRIAIQNLGAGSVHVILDVTGYFE